MHFIWFIFTKVSISKRKIKCEKNISSSIFGHQLLGVSGDPRLNPLWSSWPQGCKTSLTDTHNNNSLEIEDKEKPKQSIEYELWCTVSYAVKQLRNWQWVFCLVNIWNFNISYEDVAMTDEPNNSKDSVRFRETNNSTDNQRYIVHPSTHFNTPATVNKTKTNPSFNILQPTKKSQSFQVSLSIICNQF